MCRDQQVSGAYNSPIDLDAVKQVVERDLLILKPQIEAILTSTL